MYSYVYADQRMDGNSSTTIPSINTTSEQPERHPGDSVVISSLYYVS